MKSFINTFFIAAAVVAVSGCVPKATEKKAICGTNQAFDSVSRSCYSIEEARKTPVGTASTVSMSEETPVTVSLTYTDANKDLAKSCTISGVTTSSIDIMSPALADRSVFAHADLVYAAAVNLQTSIPAGAYYASASATRTDMLNALTIAKASYYQPTIQAQMAIFRAAANDMLTYATQYPGLTSVQNYYNITQQRLTPFDALYASLNGQCLCSGGVCTAVVIPKLNKNGAAGFSYSITDVDGAGSPKAVAVTIAATPLTATHLRPAVASGFVTGTESATSALKTYAFTVPAAQDLIGTGTAMKYYFSGSKNGTNQGVTTNGLVTGCMDLTGSTGLTDTSCLYTPVSGDSNNTTVGAGAPTKASGTIDDLTFTALSEGTAGNSISVQYYNLTDDNTLIDSKITALEKYGMVNNTNEVFLRVVGNTIKVFLNPGVTTSNMIKSLINSHAQASKMVLVTGGSAATPNDLSLGNPLTLAGGISAFDSVSYKANNGTADSTNTASVMFSITAVNDAPMTPVTYIGSAYVQNETTVEETLKSIRLTLKDVDHSTGFTVNAKIDLVGTACSASTTYFNTLVSAAGFTVGAAGAITPDVSTDVYKFDIDVTPPLDYTGSVCLYYTITDASSAVSEVQGVKLTVTPINDAPLLSTTNTLPTESWLAVTGTINEGLFATPALQNYTEIYVGPGGGTYESTQTLTVTAFSNNTSIVPNTVCPAGYATGAGAPATVPGNTTTYYFDTTNYRCYQPTGTSTAADWKLFPSLTVYKKSASNYIIAYVPIANKSSATPFNIDVTVKDNGGTANLGDIDTKTRSLALTVNFIDNPPVFLSTITTVETNEGGAVQSNGFQVDEDEGSTTDEDAQAIRITNVVTDNAAVLPTTAIRIFYDLNDNGVEDSGESRAVNAMLEATAGADSKLHKFYLKLNPVNGIAGNANVTLTISDGTNTADTSFSFIVHSVAAVHGGWTNISSVGTKADKNGAPVAMNDIKCNYNKTTDSKKCSGANCTGSISPNATIVPDAANVIFWDSANLRCYRSTSASAFSWVEMNTSCPVTRQTGVCSDNNCIVSSDPTGATVPAFVGQYLFNSSTNTCYVSTGATNADWITYVPTKVTLAWKPFTMTGTGPNSGVQIAGYNVYRREAGADYNFKGGHLKDASSTTTFTITDPTVRTFTDTTAVAGKVYYYVVRPVDTIRKFPTYTLASFSEVRVLAAPTNYSFVHRWIVNQEVCNSMNMTTTTTNKVDQTQNFRCPYSGPGDNGAGFYDYGKDLLVDIQEAGCPYAPAPRCTSDGCIGIGTSGFAGFNYSGMLANDLYYDRDSGTCYKYAGGTSWTAMDSVATITATLANSVNSALNAPLVNIKQAKASAICTARTAPTVGATLGSVILPSKKDYMAYSSQKLNITDPEITEMEQGFSLNIQSRCNGSAASGLETAYQDSAIPSTSFIYSLPGTYASGIRSLYTGSIPWGSSKGTEACVSRFGIQDLYGNVAEWTTDRMDCSAADKTCTSAGLASSYSAYDFKTSGATVRNYGFDFLTGPFNDTNTTIVGPDSADTYLTAWIFSDELFEAGKFSFPTALPVKENIQSEATSGIKDSLAIPFMLDIGPSSGITVNKLHEDGVIINAAAVNAGATQIGGFAVGGSYLSGNLAGRYTSELIPAADTRVEVGMRCIIPVSSYPADTNYTYPY